MGDEEGYEDSRHSSRFGDDARAPLVIRGRDEVRRGAEYPRSAAVTEDEEGREVDLKWDLLHPAFIAPFRRGPEKLLCVGLALRPEQHSDTLVLMSLEFYSLDKGMYLNSALVFDPFEFIAMQGDLPRVEVRDRDIQRELRLVNKTHEFLFPLTNLDEGNWQCNPLP